MFVDGDDWIDCHMVEKMLNAAIINNVDLVMCGMYKAYENTVKEYTYNIEKNKVFNKIECRSLKKKLLEYNSNIAVAYCKLIRRDVLLKNGVFHDEFLRQGAEGLEFNFRLFSYIDSAIFIDECLYYYVYNDNSISACPTDKNNECIYNCFKKIKGLILEDKSDELLYWLNNRLCYVICTTAISGYFSPKMTLSFSERVNKMKLFLKKDIFSEAISSKNYKGISFQRRIILFLVKHSWYRLVYILAKYRYKQKNRR